ncbi:putative Rha family transcriptional regulator [Vibrio phage 424E50-1]|nr:putative Rha family transcriptional regulator [Vibrio phage 424E50-1]
MIEVEMTSLDIAELTGKAHRRIRQDIKSKLLSEMSLHESVQSVLTVNTGTYRNERGRDYEVYILNSYAVNALISTYSMEHAVKLVMHIHKLELKVAEQQKQIDIMKDIVWKVIKNKSYIGRMYALQSAGVKHPRLFLRYLRENSKFYEDTYKRGLLKISTYRLTLK